MAKSAGMQICLLCLLQVQTFLLLNKCPAAIIGKNKITFSEQEFMLDNLNLGHPERPDEEGDKRITFV